MPITHGKDHGKRDADGYVCSHGVCSGCRDEVFKLWIGNEAGWRYAVPSIKDAIAQHCCKPV